VFLHTILACIVTRENDGRGILKRFGRLFFVNKILFRPRASSLGKWTYKSPVFLGENQEFSIFWPKNRAFFPITTGTYKSISLDWQGPQKEKEKKKEKF